MSPLPDVGYGLSTRRLAGEGQPEERLDRAQHVIVVDGLAVLAGLYMRPEKEREDMVGLRGHIILVPCHDQQAMVSGSPLPIRLHVLSQPTIALLKGARVHVMQLVRHAKRHCWQLGEVSRKAAKWLIARCGHIAECHPRVVLACIERIAVGSVASVVASGEPCLWQTL